MTAVTPSSSPATAHRLPSDRDTASPFWTEGLPPSLEEHTKRLFVEYSKIPEEKLEQHLDEAPRQRRKAWNYCPYPCIGLWLFLKLQLRNNKEFDEAVRRTQQGHKLLDFGCAIGQDLRSLAHAGAPLTMLYGADLVDKFFDAGFVLFKDADSGITFRQANALDQNALQEWHGQFPIVTCNYVQHCFSIEDQETFAALILKLLSGGPNDLLFGRTGGTKLEARREVIHGDQRFYRHSQTSFKQFWERMVAKFGRKASVETWIDDAPAFELKGEAKDKFEPVRNLMYAIRFT
ncbi:methyltransferase [Hirsutella rhossiliensis]|uniref:Methyltransferase domain-containing protein n=1 Tax=Hirsutella rhossiliensis TaxID=111463 RepID=A0A9P8MUQ5_9HYPO|nr:methyltransferase domain-containing protein [Hirsutella rhossiliensis]KAH0960596.1 methyltransferase domain-containing protein [Hirsutella rhossiliensis]